MLRPFADKHAITPPLLSDEGSPVIRRLGLINERVQEDHAAYGIKPDPRHTNLPYPGVFVLDESGVIVGKRFHESYRERDTGAALLAQTRGILDSGRAQAVGAPGDPRRGKPARPSRSAIDHERLRARLQPCILSWSTPTSGASTSHS